MAIVEPTITTMRFGVGFGLTREPGAVTRSERMQLLSTPVGQEVSNLVSQLGLDINLLLHEIKWALGEERINKLTPRYDKFREWTRQRDGLYKFWGFVNGKLGVELRPDEVQDIWDCIHLTLNVRRRKAFTFQDYLMIAIRSDQKCAFCYKRPPEVSLEIDHIIPV